MTVSRRNMSRPRTCKICGKVFYPFHANDPRRGKLCSRACWQKYWKAQKVLVECFHCHKLFTRFFFRPHRKRADRRRFCSKHCFALNNKTADNPLCRQAGELRYHHATKKWTDIAKDHRKSEPKCAACGAKATTTDHIVGFSVICKLAPGMDPDVPVNLMSLCRPCHGVKTQADRHLWRGNILRFINTLHVGNWPMDRVAAAGTYYGFSLRSKAPWQEDKSIKVPF